jgi:hypothetical protein
LRAALIRTAAGLAALAALIHIALSHRCLLLKTPRFLRTDVDGFGSRRE